jgi:hypothetical protein
MKLIKLILVVLFIGFSYQKCQQQRTITLGPGVKVPDAPIQTKLNQATPIAFDEYSITPLAEYEIKAKVLSRENYSFGRESDLSPVDLALGWQNMSNEAVLEHIDISQSSRWYSWSVQQFPIPRRQIETQSANVHFIPANDYVASKLKKVRKGELIEAKGYLIKAEAADGWRWQSSLTREDTGSGACEVFYVQELQIIN